MLEIIYLHIPKTAGTSILELLEQHYTQESILSVKRKLFMENSGQKPENLLLSLCHEKVKVLHGHFTWQESRLVREKFPQALCITFLRNPIDRVRSNYLYFLKRIAENKVNPQQVSRARETLLEYAQLPESQNRMCHFLEGSQASDFCFVGSFENFQKDSENLAEKLGISYKRIPKANANPLFDPKSSLTLREVQILEALNKEDRQLYESWIPPHSAFPETKNNLT
jgi:hypothetical protein